MARKKHADLAAAKAAKQKKIAIGGGLLFVALLIVSVPRTMKLMHPHQSVAKVHRASTSATDTTTAATSATAPASVPVVNTTVTPVLTAELAPEAREGQLAVLTASFKTKDPFKQLIDENPATSSAPPPAAQSSGTAKAAQPKASATLKVVPTAKPATSTPPATTAATQQPSVQNVTLPWLSAVISVNGTRGGVGLEQDFPTKAPLFHLLKLTKKTAKISVVGGSLAGGAPTLTLRLGKPLTLANTADGTRFKLVLVSTSTKPAATKTAQPAASTTPQTQAQTQTTPTQTTTTTTSDAQTQQPADTLSVPALGG